MPTLTLQSFHRATTADIAMLVSIRPDGIDVAGDNEYPGVSGDGRYVTFQTSAQLTADDVDAFTDVYVRDLLTGALTRASASAPGGQVNNNASGAHISADGRYVVFSTSANLIPDDRYTYTDVYVRDLQTGSLTRVSTKQDGTQGDGNCDEARISADGRYVVFETTAKLVDADTDTDRDVYLRDLQTGALTRVSTMANGDPTGGYSRDGDVSNGGRFVVFASYAALVADDTNNKSDVYVRDLLTQTLTRVSGKTDGANESYSDSGRISADGRYVVFVTNGQLTADDHNVNYDIYLRDLQTGALTRLTKTPEGLDVSGSYPAISPDGRYVTFSTTAQLLSDDVDQNRDLYGVDVQTGAMMRYSTMVDGSPGLDSWYSGISANGRYVVFDTSAQLVAGDQDTTYDTYRVDRVLKANASAVAEGRFVEASFAVGAASKVSIAWGDGTVETLTPVHGGIALSHAYATAGAKVATLTVQEGAQTWMVPYTVGQADMTRNLGLADTLSGGNGGETLVGDVNANVLLGFGGNDLIRGDTGNDRLSGGSGKDVLYGGAGRDTFVFDTKWAKKNANVDKLMDFKAKDDTIYLENAVFRALGNKGSLDAPAKLKASAFFFGDHAHDASDRLIVNKTGIYYDDDGTGRHAQVQIASFGKNAYKSFTFHDFLII